MRWQVDGKLNYVKPVHRLFQIKFCQRSAGLISCGGGGGITHNASAPVSQGLIIISIPIHII
jgi:hypothetical protein